LKISNNKFENLDNINDNKISNDNKIYTLDYYKDLLAILGEEYKTNHDLSCSKDCGVKSVCFSQGGNRRNTVLSTQARRPCIRLLY
jgi:hypothetical protein